MKKLLKLVLLVLLFSIPAQADRLTTIGLETNNFTQTMWNSKGSVASIVTTPVHSGTYSLKSITTGSPNGSSRIILAANKTSGTLVARSYVRIAALPTATDQLYFFGSISLTRSLEANLLNVSSNGRIQLKNVITGTTDDSTFDLALNTWYRLEAELLLSDTVGTMEIRVFLGDSTTQLFTALTITSEDTLPSNIRYLVVGQNSQLSGEIYFDDICINDEAGTFQNSFPGPGKIFLLKPSGDNTVTWTKDGSSPAATNFEGVDDVPGLPNDGTDYNSSTTNQTDKLDLSNLGAEVTSNADIILVDVYGRQGSDGTAGTRVIDFELWDEADSQNTLLDISADLNGWRICDSDEHLVFDAGARTKANIDAFRVGYSRSISGSNEIRITAQWVNVEWIEAAAVTVKPARREIKID